MLAEDDTVVLATCGECGPSVSVVSQRVQGERLYLFLADASEHLFNLQSRSQVVLLSPRWELHGHGVIETESVIASPKPWLRCFSSTFSEVQGLGAGPCSAPTLKPWRWSER